MSVVHRISLATSLLISDWEQDKYLVCTAFWHLYDFQSLKINIVVSFLRFRPGYVFMLDVMNEPLDALTMCSVVNSCIGIPQESGTAHGPQIFMYPFVTVPCLF